MYIHFQCQTINTPSADQGAEEGRKKLIEIRKEGRKETEKENKKGEEEKEGR